MLYARAAWGFLPKLLAQANPAATTLTDIYTAPGPVQIAEIWVANRDASAHTFRMSVASGGAVDSAEQYIYYGVSVPAASALVQSVNLPLDTGDVVRVWADAQQLSFSLYGTLFSFSVQVTNTPTPTPTPSQTPTPTPTPT